MIVIKSTKHSLLVLSNGTYIPLISFKPLWPYQASQKIHDYTLCIRDDTSVGHTRNFSALFIGQNRTLSINLVTCLQMSRTVCANFLPFQIAHHEQ